MEEKFGIVLLKPIGCKVYDWVKLNDMKISVEDKYLIDFKRGVISVRIIFIIEKNKKIYVTLQKYYSKNDSLLLLYDDLKEDEVLLSDNFETKNIESCKFTKKIENINCVGSYNIKKKERRKDCYELVKNKRLSYWEVVKFKEED
jgi:hypothetical protein